MIQKRSPIFERRTYLLTKNYFFEYPSFNFPRLYFFLNSHIPPCPPGKNPSISRSRLAAAKERAPGLEAKVKLKMGWSHGCFRRIVGFFPPNHPLNHRVFHYFHHPFWGYHPYFWISTHICKKGWIRQIQGNRLGKSQWWWPLSGMENSLPNQPFPIVDLAKQRLDGRFRHCFNFWSLFGEDWNFSPNRFTCGVLS